MPEPRVAHALICDEIRGDLDGRVSYVGVHSGEMIVNANRRGSQLHFAAIVWLICDADDVPSKIILRVYGPPGRRLLATNEIQPPQPPRRADSTKSFFQVGIERAALPLHQEGDIEISVETETGVLRAGRLRVRFADDVALQPARLTIP